MSQSAKALVLQGGGALGAYQAGVYEALAQSDGRLDWVAGVSIGAINAALIVGNAPEHRVARLREFWRQVSSAPAQNVPPALGARALQGQWSAAAAALVGIPGFFRPRVDPTLLLGGAAPVLSYYDTAPLKSTLERLVDFDRINRGEVRLSVGAVNLRSGNSTYFDNTLQRIGAEHIMASGALPPGFAPIHIDGEDYWDGGILSNTPLQYVLDAHAGDRPLVVLQVDLFGARGPMPRTLSEVLERQKDITYSSRTRMNTDALGANANLRHALADLVERLPARLRSDPALVTLLQGMEPRPIDIVHLIYRDKPYELDTKDTEFSRAMVEEHWNAGMRDMHATIAHPEWLRKATRCGVTTYDLAGPEARVRRPGRPAAGP
ncbi:MAG: patatin-like phospholipase family protein [Burkholderiales bacterium]|nr:patatin-like phospholipase family protein [Burkholderiales bacterium]